MQALKNGLLLAGYKGDGTIVVIGAALILTILAQQSLPSGRRRLTINDAGAPAGLGAEHTPRRNDHAQDLSGPRPRRWLRRRRPCRLGLDGRRRPADQPARLRRDAGAAAAKPYDGGAPTGAPDRKGKPIKVVDMPKLIGIGYFNATSKGIADAAKELGNVDAKTDGPTKANIDEQITFIDNYITSGVDGILFAANDPVAIAPVLKKALVEGHQRRRLRRQLDARRPPMVRQPGRVQRHRQGADRQHGQGSRRGCRRRHRHLDLHHAQPGALDLRDGRLCRQVPSQDELAGDGRSAGGQQPVLQPGDDADQQAWRPAQGHLRHDLRRDAGLGRGGDAGRPVRQDRRRRPRHARTR